MSSTAIAVEKRYGTQNIQVGRAGLDRHGAVHGDPRRGDRERGPALDQDRPRLLVGGPPVGDHGLRDLLRRRSAPRWTDRRPARTAPRLHRRPLGLRRELAPLRPCLVGGLSDRVPRAPGPRRGTARSGRARAADDDLRRRPRAQPRARHLRGRLGERRRSRRAARRDPDLLPALVVDLLHQRAGRDRRDRGHAVAAPREPCQPPAPPLRLRRRRLDHRRADAARLRDDAGDHRRLGLRDDDRPDLGVRSRSSGSSS